MKLDRRHLLKFAATAPVLMGAGAALTQSSIAPAPMTGNARDITPAEHQARIDAAQKLIREQKLSGVFLEVGPSLTYFTGLKWWRTERLAGAVIPPEGVPLVILSAFEEDSITDTLKVKANVRVWQEDENPLAIVADWLRGHKLDRDAMGIEETVRFMMTERLRAQLPKMALVSADPVVTACRSRKSAAEIALMQVATDVTLAAYAQTIPQIRPGMSQDDVVRLMLGAMEALGGEDGWSLVLVGEASAYPHGSKNPKNVERGDLILMDCGCGVKGYQSDISRTFIFDGAPTPEQQRVWDIVHRGQQIAFETAQIGTPAGQVDDAVRRHYEAQGFGPGYRLPGLSHRTGHGIGMETHEAVYLVHGERTPLAAGMCFSDEPGIYAPGSFGVRLEDCIHMTANGPAWFSQPSRSITQPI